MAAHLRRNIRLYVGGNRFSPSFSPLFGSRPFMGARSLSSSSMLSSPNQAPQRVKTLSDVIVPAFAAGVIYSGFEWMDFFEWRTSYDSYRADLVRKKVVRVQVECLKLQSEIDTIKMKNRKRVAEIDNEA